MATENARKFVDKVMTDAALNERVKDMKPEAVLACAKEQGLDFTEEELKAALGDEKLSLEDLDNVAGGNVVGGSYLPKKPSKKDTCPGNASGDHEWVKTGHVEDPHSFLWIDYTIGYDIYTCSCCGKTKREHV